MPEPPAIPDRVLELLRAAYAAPVAPASLTLLTLGKYGNANVYRYTEGGRDLVVKEFYSRSWFIRATLGGFFIRREARALADLEGIAGIPPGGRRLGPAALAEAFVEGETLVQLHRVRQVRLPRAFFLDFERLVGDMHRAGYAHLDLRNLGNVLCSRDGRPCIFDFQSCMRTARWPRFVRRIMENSDRSGIYKCWSKLCAEPLDPERAAFMARFSGTRKFWVFKGYWFEKTWHKLTRRQRN
jgi:hypothetical protein